MIPSVEHVMKKRHQNRRRLRFLALSLLIVAAIVVTWPLLAVCLSSERDWSDVHVWLALGLSLTLSALSLWLFDDRLARALVPMPRRECPACRYDLTSLSHPVCPECGLALPSTVLSPAPEPDYRQPAIPTG